VPIWPTFEFRHSVEARPFIHFRCLKVIACHPDACPAGLPRRYRFESRARSLVRKASSTHICLISDMPAQVYPAVARWSASFVVDANPIPWPSSRPVAARLCSTILNASIPSA
jgi:hypothetical protein